MLTSPTTPATAIRSDIQGLRAIAVLAVLAFHIFPGSFTGGYVGVDVFFVISGFLITKMLLSTAERKGRISLVDFYARRISRLLPAALLVLFAVIAALPLLPAARWEETVADVVAAALYYINWRQAFLAVDYLGAENAASPVQHFWSLAIEEQFYAVWGVLLVGIGFLAARGRIPFRRLVQVFLVATFTVSLALSVWLTYAEPESAYFVSHTRAWELALGALLASVRLPQMSRQVATALRATGIALILFACLTYSGSTAFPGWLALIPTLGAAFVIAAGGAHGHSDDIAARLLGTRPSVFIGDISYSLYLWHWPFIVFFEAYSGRKLDLLSGLVVALASILVAWISKVHVEDRFRSHGALPSRRAWSVVAAGTLTTLLCVAAGLGFVNTVQRNAPTAVAAAAMDMMYPGPHAIAGGAPVPAVDEFLPPAAQVKRDLPSAYAEKCHLDVETSALNPCIRGDAASATRIVLAGDSHAANWLPALEAMADSNGWYLESHTKSGCGFLTESVKVRGGEYIECRQWGENLLGHLAELDPALIVIAQSAGQSLFDTASGSTMESALLALWQELERQGFQVVVIADTPRHTSDPTSCLEQSAMCGTERSVGVRPDPIVKAARMQTAVQLVDMNDLVCTADFCPAVIGNVVTFRDAHHLTATYSRMLAPFLEERIRAFIDLPSPAGGAKVSAPPVITPETGQTRQTNLIPPIKDVKRDLPRGYREKCHLRLKDAALAPCLGGDETASFRVVLAGDSHAVQWLPALDLIAEARGFRLESHTKAGCPLVSDTVYRNGREYEECNRRNQLLLAELRASPPDLIVMTHKARGNPVSNPRGGTIIDSILYTWRQLHEIGIPVAVISDTPRHLENPVECLDSAGPCGTARKQAIPADPLRSAARRDPDVHLIDMNDQICGKDFCPATLGNVITYRDRNHLTATFVQMLAPYLDARLADAAVLPTRQ